MRIHLGHHFYGAGNLGDDFMLAGFLAAMHTAAPQATFTCSIPFEREPARQRFPEIEWLPYDNGARARAVAACDVWLGLGGSPFQSEQSRWFIDHLIGEAALCARLGKPMFFLGVGVQTVTELDRPEVRQLCTQAVHIWTRDTASADRLLALPSPPSVSAAADLAHILFSTTPPPPALAGRFTLVPNFDFNAWPGQAACLRAIASLPVREHIWLAQESRALPGAERALHAALPDGARATWQLTAPDDRPSMSLRDVLRRWPSGEWLVSSRFHAVIAGAWTGSKIVVIGTNEKLRGIAREFALTLISPDADEATVAIALAAAKPVPAALLSDAARRASASVVEFVQAASSRPFSQSSQS